MQAQGAVPICQSCVPNTMRPSVNEKCEHIAGVQKMSVREVGSDIVFFDRRISLCPLSSIYQMRIDGKEIRGVTSGTQRTR